MPKRRPVPKVLATETGFALSAPLQTAIRFHRKTYAAAQAATDEIEMGRLLKIERNALDAVLAARVRGLRQAADRALYLADFWWEYGEGGNEGENAYRYLHSAITSMRHYVQP